MRNSFIRTLTELAAQDERIVLLTGDLGFHVIEPFAETFPDRFYNVGVAEQNMAGIATGMAEAGLLPFIYSIAPFSTLRPYEFLRNGAIHQNLPVRIVAVGAGYAYGELGPSHHLIEDIAVFRPHDNLATMAPVDPSHAQALLAQSYDLPQPVYYRLGKNEAIDLPRLNGDSVSELATLRQGKDALVFTLGEASAELMQAAQALSQASIGLEVQAISTINPLPKEQIIQRVKMHTHCITYEEHYMAGGIGSILAEIITDEALSCRLLRLASSHKNDGRFGNQAFMLAQQELDAASVAMLIKAMLEGENQ